MVRMWPRTCVARKGQQRLFICKLPSLTYLGASWSAEQRAVHTSPVTDLDCARLELHLGTSEQRFPTDR